MKQTIGTRIKQARADLFWTQAELSEHSGVNAMAISHFEHDRREPTIRNAVRLCVALGVTLDWLVRGKENS